MQWTNNQLKIKILRHVSVNWIRVPIFFHTNTWTWTVQHSIVQSKENRFSNLKIVGVATSVKFF